MFGVTLGADTAYVVLQASSDQTNVDLFLPFFVWMSVSMYITVISVLIVTCQVAWPSVIAIIPLVILNIWYRVSLCFHHGNGNYYL